MNKKEKINNLLKDIQDLYTIANRLDHEEQIHPLDIDLALSKVRNLYDLLLTINPQTAYKTEYQKKETEKNIVREEIAEKKKPEIEEKPTKEEVPSQNEPEFIIEKTSQKQEPAAKVIEKEEDKDTPVKNEEIKSTQEKKEKQPEGTSIVADKFQSKKFIHDNMSKKNSKKDVSSKLQSKPIQDINSAIGLNDKFIFIRELFNGDKEQYLETIQILNNFDSYDNALGFLNENFDWNDDDVNFERLKELVKRKFAAK
ncbi:MAG: hypothetical protein ACLFVR_08385 [Thiohalospira sp.]